MDGHTRKQHRKSQKQKQRRKKNDCHVEQTQWRVVHIVCNLSVARFYDKISTRLEESDVVDLSVLNLYLRSEPLKFKNLFCFYVWALGWEEKKNPAPEAKQGENICTEGTYWGLTAGSNSANPWATMLIYNILKISKCCKIIWALVYTDTLLHDKREQEHN